MSASLHPNRTIIEKFSISASQMEKRWQILLGNINPNLINQCHSLLFVVVVVLVAVAALIIRSFDPCVNRRQRRKVFRGGEITRNQVE